MFMSIEKNLSKTSSMFHEMAEFNTTIQQLEINPGNVIFPSNNLD